MHERGRQVVGTQRGRLGNRQEMQAALEQGHRSRRLSGDQDHGCDLPAFEFREGFSLREDDFLDLDVEAPEHIAHGIAGAASARVEIDLLPLQLVERGDIIADNDVGLFICGQLGDVDDLVVEAANLLVGTPEAVENVGLRQADIDALERSDVCGPPMPTTGKIRRLSPSLSTTARSYAICREVSSELGLPDMIATMLELTCSWR